MGGRLIGTYFFIPQEKRPASDTEIYAKLGEQPNGSFGPLVIAQRNVTALEQHICAQLYFLANDLSDLRFAPPEAEIPLESDPALPFAYAIRDGTVAVGAEVAILETHNSELQGILDRYWMVQFGDPGEFLLERFGLTCFSETMIEDWEPPVHLLDRDELPGGPGKTFFARRGRHRWF